MNERNVAALATVIEVTGIAPNHASWLLAMAKALAARGVLVPSALTDEEGYGLGMLGDFTMNRTQEREAIEAKLVRDELEHIAKGDT